MNWFLAVVQKKYATFTGRASKAEFWYYILFYVIGSFITAAIDAALGSVAINTIYTLALFVPTIAVAARRLHDIDKSGWWQLIGFIPLIGLIILIVWYATKSDAGSNRFGEPAPATP
jgi:uncharacterized membrane protein YhaH (DUF805 family)